MPFFPVFFSEDFSCLEVELNGPKVLFDFIWTVLIYSPGLVGSRSRKGVY